MKILNTTREVQMRKRLGDMCLHYVITKRDQSKGFHLEGDKAYCASGECDGNCLGYISREQYYAKNPK